MNDKYELSLGMIKEFVAEDNGIEINDYQAQKILKYIFCDLNDEAWELVTHAYEDLYHGCEEGYPSLEDMKHEASSTSLSDFNAESVGSFNREYAGKYPIRGNDDAMLFWTSIGVPDDEHGFIVAIKILLDTWTCEFVRAGRVYYRGFGHTPSEAWANTRLSFLNS